MLPLCKQSRHAEDIFLTTFYNISVIILHIFFFSIFHVFLSFSIIYHKKEEKAQIIMGVHEWCHKNSDVFDPSSSLCHTFMPYALCSCVKIWLPPPPLCMMSLFNGLEEDQFTGVIAINKFSIAATLLAEG